MALLTIVDDQGKAHLIHSSQIGPNPRRAIATGAWPDVWARVDAGIPSFAALRRLGCGTLETEIRRVSALLSPPAVVPDLGAMNTVELARHLHGLYELEAGNRERAEPLR